ncbi:MAG: type III pantothenate kinase [Calditerrivibrio sp.]|nr:type III pantothenate kinase [Calditerrivibrio sp.]MCA1981195.1 type III pantothenate kinase [Calditerrivibrio sp.]
MIFAVDIGNTNIVIGVFNRDEIIFNSRLATDYQKTTDEYAAIIMLLLKNSNIEISDIRGTIISSVVPQLVYTFTKLSKKYLSREAIVVGPGVKTGVPIKIENPKEVGSDRIVNAAAVLSAYKYPAIIIDFGTATTFDVINENGEYIGGVICPGVKLSATILHQKTAKLPEVEIEKCEKVVGTNTINSIKSGIYYGYLSLVDGIIERIILEKFKNIDPCVIATGGLGSVFMGESKYLKKYEPNLTLNGLKVIYEKNS